MQCPHFPYHGVLYARRTPLATTLEMAASGTLALSQRIMIPHRGQPVRHIHPGDPTTPPVPIAFLYDPTRIHKVR